MASLNPQITVHVLIDEATGEVIRNLEEIIRDLRYDVETLKRVAAVRERNN